MILSGPEIREQVARGNIVIDPFEEARLNPNSYNYRLSDTLTIYNDDVLDARTGHVTDQLKISPTGITLYPNRTYLGRTMEYIGSRKYVPSLIGRSSLGRLGVFLQVSADLGNLGVVHRWTLEIVVCQPIKLYPTMVVGQVSFWTPDGDFLRYKGHYGLFDLAVPSEPTLLFDGERRLVNNENSVPLHRTRLAWGGPLKECNE